jgi:SAM-dependent methyltransferase
MNASATYDHHAPYWLKKVTLPKALRSALEGAIGSDDIVLDVGCGGGRIAEKIAPRVREMWGVDFSSILIEAAHKRNPAANVVCGDVQDPATWERLHHVFDVVVSNVAIRKDHCPLDVVLDNLRYHQGDHPTKVVFYIQGDGDLPGVIDSSPFYSAAEIREMFPGCTVRTIRFEQKFSSSDYLKLFLDRIGVKVEMNNLSPFSEKRFMRQYHLVEGKL